MKKFNEFIKENIENKNTNLDSVKSLQNVLNFIESNINTDAYNSHILTIGLMKKILSFYDIDVMHHDINGYFFEAYIDGTIKTVFLTDLLG